MELLVEYIAWNGKAVVHVKQSLTAKTLNIYNRSKLKKFESFRKQLKSYVNICRKQWPTLTVISIIYLLVEDSCTLMTTVVG